MGPHLERIKGLYRAKRDVILSALKETMPPHIRWTEPEGGLFIWVTCPEGMDTDALFAKAVKAGVAYIPGQQVLPDRGGAAERDAAEFLLCDAGRPPGGRDARLRPPPGLTGREATAPAVH